MKPQSRLPSGTLRKPLCAQTDFPLKDITQHIISCAIEVHSTLGPGLLESVYEEALAHEFSLRKLRYERQKEICLRYKGKDIGSH
jgi:GxxExxY protein